MGYLIAGACIILVLGAMGVDVLRRIGAFVVIGIRLL